MTHVSTIKEKEDQNYTVQQDDLVPVISNDEAVAKSVTPNQLVNQLSDDVTISYTGVSTPSPKFPEFRLNEDGTPDGGTTINMYAAQYWHGIGATGQVPGAYGQGWYEIDLNGQNDDRDKPFITAGLRNRAGTNLAQWRLFADNTIELPFLTVSSITSDKHVATKEYVDGTRVFLEEADILVNTSGAPADTGWLTYDMSAGTTAAQAAAADGAKVAILRVKSSADATVGSAGSANIYLQKGGLTTLRGGGNTVNEIDLYRESVQDRGTAMAEVHIPLDANSDFQYYQFNSGVTGHVYQIYLIGYIK